MIKEDAHEVMTQLDLRRENSKLKLQLKKKEEHIKLLKAKIKRLEKGLTREEMDLLEILEKKWNMRDKIIYEKIKEAMNLLDEIDNMINTQSTELQQIDYELSDWYHYIENNSLDENSSKKVLEEIQRLRKIRRSLNNEHEIENTYKNNYSKVMGSNTRPFLLAEINKTINRLNNDYKNRVLTEEKINELLSCKKRRGRPRKERMQYNLESEVN